MAAAYLGTLSKRPPTDRDFVRVIGSQAGERTMAKLEATPMDTVGMGRLYRIQAIANDETLTHTERATQLVAAMEELAPGSDDVKLAQALQQAAEAEARIEEVERQARENTGKMLVQVLLLLTSGQPMPEWMAEAYPELASLDFTALAGGKKRTGPAQITEAAPRTLADRERQWLLQALRPKGITSLSKTPAKRQGVWVAASEVAALTDGAPTQDAARDLIKSLPETETSGGRKVARFREVMDRLLVGNLLPPELRDSLTFLREPGEVVDSTLVTSESATA